MLFSDLKEAKKQRDQVSTLDLSGQQLSVVPTVIKKFPALTILDISNNPMEELPAWLPILPNLTTLNIGNIPIKKLPKTLVNCRALKVVKSKGHSTKIKKELHAILRIIEDTNRFKLDDKSRMLWSELYFEKRSTKKPADLLIEATNSSLEEIQKKALQTISWQFEKNSKKHKINQQSRLVFAGILKNRTQLQDRLTGLEIHFGNILKENTTHLLIGTHTTIGQSDLPWLDQCILLTEKDLQKQLDNLETPYLMTEELEEGVRNLLHMLKSTDDQLELAIEIMSGGGVPQSLETEVFVVWKLHYNSYFQAKARRLLERFAQPYLANFIKDDTVSLTAMTEIQLEAYLKRCQKKGGLDAHRIVEELYAKHRKGLRFIFAQDQSDLQQSILAQRLDGDTLNLSGMGISSLPKGIKIYQNLKHLNLSQNPIKETPVDLKFFHQLETLNLTGTNVKDLPDWLSEISSLRKIILIPSKTEASKFENWPFPRIELVDHKPEK